MLRFLLVVGRLLFPFKNENTGFLTSRIEFDSEVLNQTEG